MLFLRKRFFGFFWTQFFGAFNDNLFKQSIVFMVTFRLTQSLSKSEADFYVSLGAGLFILPYILFSNWASVWADRAGKTKVIQATKGIEVFVMSLGAIGYYMLDSTDPTLAIHWLLLVLFLMGTQSSLFGPSKYGIMPEILNDAELTGGNGWLEMGTFVSILLGTYLGGWLVEWFGAQPVFISLFCIGVSVIGLLSSMQIPKTLPAGPNAEFKLFFLGELIKDGVDVVKNPVLLQTVFGISYFWFAGAVFLQILPGFGLFVGASAIQTNFLMVIFSVGIGVGSLLCERLSRGLVEMGLVPLGVVGMSLFCLDFGFFHPEKVQGWASLFRVFIDLFGIGCFAGFFIVPLNALLQQRPQPAKRARMIAFNNVINAFFMVASAVFVLGLRSWLGFDEPFLFAVIGLSTLVVGLILFWGLPEFLGRFILWCGTRFWVRYEQGSLEALQELDEGLWFLTTDDLKQVAFVQMATRHKIHFVALKQSQKWGWFYWSWKLLNNRTYPDTTAVVEAIKSDLAQNRPVCVVIEGHSQKTMIIDAVRQNTPLAKLGRVEVTERPNGWTKTVGLQLLEGAG